jgi:hypothetical protein
MITERIDIDAATAATLANICTVAAEQYEAHAKAMRDSGFPSLARQFSRQGVEAQRWAYTFHALESGTLIVEADEEGDEA